MTPDDTALYEAMQLIPLKPGQMLFVGPKSIALLLGKVDLEDSPDGYSDKFVVERKDWNR